MNDVGKQTGDFYGRLFHLTDDSDYTVFQGIITPAAMDEDDSFFKGKHILELGSGGIGHAIAGFLSHGARTVTGVDVSKQNIERLKKRFKNNSKVRLIHHDICHLQDSLKNFDIVYSDGVIHHTYAPEKAIHGAYKAMNPGGTILIGLYGSGGLIIWILTFLRAVRQYIPQNIFYSIFSTRWPKIAFYLGDYLYAPILRTYSESQARRLLEEAGFTHIVRIKNRSVITGVKKYLHFSQLDHTSLVSRILYGTGWITMKAIK